MDRSDHNYTEEEIAEAFAAFRQDALQMQIDLSDDQMAAFRAFYDDLIETNRVMNLTAITEPKEVMTKHFLDSLSLVRVRTLSVGDKLLDLGTGGGFPGMPLHILQPEAEITLADALNKRINFLNRHIEAHQMQHITAVHGRAEEMARKSEYREVFDVVVSRAVANLSTLCEYTLPFVNIGGQFIAYKSGAVDKELAESKHAVAALGGKITKIDTFSLPGGDYDRSLVVIEKVKKTPKTYPRKAGTPAKNPIT